MDPTTAQTIQSISEITNTFSVWLGPLMVAVFSVMMLFLIKDLLASVAQGVRFMLHPAFNEGDKIFLDGDKATIVKIGLFTTVFGIYNHDNAYCWRYVPNERIKSLKLEKIINPIINQKP